MALPAVIGVAAASGPFHAVAMGNNGTATSWASGAGDKMQIVLSASWRVGGRRQSLGPPCTDPIDDVTRLEKSPSQRAHSSSTRRWHEVLYFARGACR